MPSRLSSLLVRDGVVSVKRMEHAFQRQVIHGGCLDSILLEMNLLAEERLVQYLSLATGLPPATRRELKLSDAKAAELCSVEVGRMYRVVPLCLDNGALRVLVHDPVDMVLLEELANELDVPIQPLVVPEYRFHVAFAGTYGGTADVRYERLANRADERSPSQPVGKARSVIVEDVVHQVVDIELTNPRQRADQRNRQDKRTRLMGSGAAEQRSGEADAELGPDEYRDESLGGGEHGNRAPSAGRRAETYPGLGPRMPPANRPLTERDVVAYQDTSPVAVRGPEASSGLAIGDTGGRRVSPDAITPVQGVPISQIQPHQSESSASLATPPGDDADSANGTGTADAGRRSSNRASTHRGAHTAGYRPEYRGAYGAPHGAADDTPAPIQPETAGELLSRANDRDTIFRILLSAVRHYAHYAGLLTVQGNAAIGRMAIRDNEFDRSDIAQVLIPLLAPSPFGTVMRSASPHFGPLYSGKVEIDYMLDYLEYRTPSQALILPIVMRERVVAMVVGHNSEESVDLASVTALLPVASQTTGAITRLIIRTKASGYRQPRMASAPMVSAEALVRKGGGGARFERGRSVWSVPDSPPEAPALSDSQPLGLVRGGGRSISVTERTPAPIGTVLDAVEGDDAEMMRRAASEAMERIDETLAVLYRRFPGRLLVERYELEGKVISASEHGPLLALIVQLGNKAADLLIEKMASEDREVRYYAVLCAAELRPRSAVTAFVDRLFDSDYGIRTSAIAALAAYPPDVLEYALVRVRRVLGSDTPAQVQAAANALAKLGDVEAIEGLIKVLEEGSTGTEAARRALVQLTKQDFASNIRKWNAWWAKHHRAHRIEWLIDGLAHKDDNIRREAADELRALTGEYFGFHYDLSKREREQARERWLDWWQRIGRQRFLRATSSAGRTPSRTPSHTDRR